jgi:predicted polyphosphate/ATP-dependent NAD kinase
MGGSVALKGTDGPAIMARARALGARPSAAARAGRALARLAAGAGPSVRILAAPGPMGAEIARGAGLAVEETGQGLAKATTAADSMAAAEAMRRAKVDLILFAGGDGTARDILSVVGDSLPMLGLPAGVKMRSSLFATSPEAAGELLALMAVGDVGRITFRTAEVLDIDEAGLREGRLSARLYGYARVPDERRLVQSPKSGEESEDATLDSLCREVAEEMRAESAAGIVHLLGPGTTTAQVMRHLGLEGSLLGVDAVQGGCLLGRDLSARDLAALVEGRPLRIILAVIGGQGFIFGRGNQQIDAALIRAAGRDNILLLASQRKLLGLGSNRLFADTGDRAVDAMLAGYIRVRIGPGRATLMRIVTDAGPMQECTAHT